MQDLKLTQTNGDAIKTLEVFDNMLSLELEADGDKHSIGWRFEPTELVQLIVALRHRQTLPDMERAIMIQRVTEGLEAFFKVFDDGIITVSEFKGLYPELWQRLSTVIVKANMMEVFGS